MGDHETQVKLFDVADDLAPRIFRIPFDVDERRMAEGPPVHGLPPGGKGMSAAEADEHRDTHFIFETGHFLQHLFPEEIPPDIEADLHDIRPFRSGLLE